MSNVASKRLSRILPRPAPGHVCSFRLVGRSGSSTDKVWADASTRFEAVFFSEATAVLSERAQELVAEQMRHGFRFLVCCGIGVGACLQ